MQEGWAGSSLRLRATPALAPEKSDSAAVAATRDLRFNIVRVDTPVYRKLNLNESLGKKRREAVETVDHCEGNDEKERAGHL